jgi:DNA-binding beta-propeller fold protein YncE
VLSPDDRYLYVPSDGNPSGLLVIDTQNPSSIVTIPVMQTFRDGSRQAVPVNRAAMTRDGELLFLVETSSTSKIFVIDTSTGQQVAEFFPPQQQGTSQDLADVAIDPTGSRLYVAAA